ncbi:hypothetical protein Poly51_35940 [Rubripirellula tenax]|uniref:Cytochrome c domain-containing protein n=1 Tax=Rubripirellula tenax TaxID=2528015 RepID=A0A5C6F0Q1_9BACT|nr:DUF1549 domain-containing protein [Rubripirellula tenax]TWU54872.1 hypothetical protein Poly51_35940 [Rubripirellula tenax]
MTVHDPSSGFDRDDASLREQLRSVAETMRMPSDADQRIRERMAQCYKDAEQHAVPINIEAARSQRRAPAWLAFVVAASVMLAFFLLVPSGKAYSFEAMLRAIRDQPLVRAMLTQASGAESIGWLRQRGGVVVAVETRDRVVWWDDAQNKPGEFSRTTGAVPAPMDSASTDSLSDDPQMMLLQLLTAIRSQSGDLHWTIRSESWKEVGDLVELRVELEFNNHTSKETTYVFGIDPKSQVPQWVRIESSGITSTVQLRYPDSGPTSLASLGVKLPAVEMLLPKSADSIEVSEPELIASLPTTPAGETPRSKTPADEPNASAAPLGDNSSSSQANPMVATRLAARRWQSTSAVEVPTLTQDMVSRVDQRLEELWRQRSVDPVDPADSYQLTRRLYLDLTGRVPRIHEIKSSLDLEPSALVEELLASREFSNHMATVWSRLLLPEAVDLSQFGGVEAFNAWLANQFADNVGYDEIVRQLLQAEGRVGESGPVLFYTALQLKPDELAKQTARVFLGSRIDCAQCHDHPTDDWTQQDFWAYAAFFARISRPEGRMEAMSPVLRVRDVPRGDVKIPDTEQIVQPRFLGGEAFAEQPGEALRRQALSKWMTNSRQFSRATVNHVWTHFFGVGLVDPADDFGPHNPSVSPELLDELAEFLIQCDFDLRELVRVITSSGAYRLGSESEVHSADQLRYYAQMNTKWLTAEQLYDALMTSTRSTQSFVATDETMTSMMFADTSRAAFIEKFKAPRGSAIDYQAGIPQALSMMNGLLTLQATEAESSGMMNALSAPFFTDSQRVETIFMAVVSRPPASEELDTILPMLDSAASVEEKQQVLSDLFWAILNTAEFSTNH